MPGVTAVESFEQFKEIINSDKYTVFDFWATWCGPCRVISPVFEKFSHEKDFENIEFYKVDVDAQEAIAQEVGIRVMPTFILFKQGEVVANATGAIPQNVQALLAKAV